MRNFRRAVKLVLYRIKLNNQIEENLDGKLACKLQGVDSMFQEDEDKVCRSISSDWQGWKLYDTFIFLTAHVQQVYLTMYITWGTSILWLTLTIEAIFAFNLALEFFRSPYNDKDGRPLPLKETIFRYLKYSEL